MEVSQKKEKELLKKWKRDWKIQPIEEMNPKWSDLSINWELNYNKIRE